MIRNSLEKINTPLNSGRLELEPGVNEVKQDDEVADNNQSMLGVKMVAPLPQDFAEGGSDEHKICDKDVFQSRRKSVNQIDQKNDSQYRVEVIVVPGHRGKKRNQDKQVGAFQDLRIRKAALLPFEHHSQQKQAGNENQTETQSPG